MDILYRYCNLSNGTNIFDETIFCIKKSISRYLYAKPSGGAQKIRPLPFRGPQCYAIEAVPTYHCHARTP